jgi:hypothetical protein
MSSISFNEWMAQVNALVLHKTGVSVHDLADMSFHDWYDDGITPPQAVKLVLEEAL